MGPEPTDRTRQQHLEWCMAQMASGDDAALFTFVDSFGDQVEAQVRRIVGGLFRSDILADGDEINGLVLNVCLAIHDRASGWHPGGAPPWVWAHSAIRQVVISHVGHRQVADETGIEGDVNGDQTVGADVTPDTWHALTNEHPYLQLLDQVLLEEGSARDRWIFIEYLTQQGSGDPSPANTVGEVFTLSPANVRQIVRRQRVKLKRRAEGDPHFAPLLELPLVSAA